MQERGRASRALAVVLAAAACACEGGAAGAELEKRVEEPQPDETVARVEPPAPEDGVRPSDPGAPPEGTYSILERDRSVEVERGAGEAIGDTEADRAEPGEEAALAADDTFGPGDAQGDAAALEEPDEEGFDDEVTYGDTDPFDDEVTFGDTDAFS